MSHCQASEEASVVLCCSLQGLYTESTTKSLQRKVTVTSSEWLPFKKNNIDGVFKDFWLLLFLYQKWAFGGKKFFGKDFVFFGKFSFSLFFLQDDFVLMRILLLSLLFNF